LQGPRPIFGRDKLLAEDDPLLDVLDALDLAIAHEFIESCWPGKPIVGHDDNEQRRLLQRCFNLVVEYAKTF
jgi:hypothetical protein